MKPIEKPKENSNRNLLAQKCCLFYYEGRFKIVMQKFNSVSEAFNWCKANCEDQGFLDFYHQGKKMFLEIIN